MTKINDMTLTFPALSENEAFSRTSVAAFVTRLDPTLNDLMDIKTAVSEAVTNAIIHGYENSEGYISVHCEIKNREVKIEITDSGIGIDDIDKAKEPLFTTKPEQERSGMGFSVMEAFMDKVHVKSARGKGTKITMCKTV